MAYQVWCPVLHLYAGLNFAPMYNFNNYFRAGLSLDAQYDESANIKDYKLEGSFMDDLKFHRPPFREQFAVGLSLRAEWVMPIFCDQCRYWAKSDMQWG